MSTKNVLSDVLVLSRTNYVTFSDVEKEKKPKEKKRLSQWIAFGSWYAGKREEAGKTQDQVSEKLNMSVKTISRIENGDSTKYVTVKRMVEVIGADFDEAVAIAFPSKKAKEIENIKVVEGIELNLRTNLNLSGNCKEEIIDAIRFIITGYASDTKINSFIISALNLSGEDVDEIIRYAQFRRERNEIEILKIRPPQPPPESPEALKLEKCDNVHSIDLKKKVKIA